MAVSVVTFVGSKAVDAESAAGGWNAGTDDSDNFVEGTQAIGLKVSGVGATQDFYDQSIAGGPYGFDSGGGDEGEHIFGWFNTLTPATLHAIIVGENQVTTDSFGRWDVGPPSGYGGGWIAYVIDPTRDFDSVQAGDASWTTTGNPAQLDAVDIMGGHHTVASMISGNFNNALVDATSVGWGYRITNGDGVSDDAIFGDFITFEQTVGNRYGGLNSTGGVLFMRSQLVIGTTTASVDTDFTDANVTVIWLDAPVATDFYQLTVEEGTGTTNVTMNNVTLKAEDIAQAALPAFDFTGATATTLTNVSLIGGRAVTLDTACTLDGGLWQACGQIIPGASSNVTDVLILDPTDDGALLITGASQLDDWSSIDFDGAGIGGASTDAAIEVDITGAGPHEIDLDLFIFSNRVSGSVDMHFLDNGIDATYEVNVLNNGTTPTYTSDRGTSTVNINAAKTLTLTNVIPGSSCSIIDTSGEASDGDVLLSQRAVPSSFGYFTADGNDHVETVENADVSSASGDFEIISYTRSTDWTPATEETILSQWDGTAATQAFRYYADTTGVIGLQVGDGSANTDLLGNAHSHTDATFGWNRVVYDQSAGQASFYSSTDDERTHPTEVTWTARGTPSGTSRSMPDANVPLLIGAENSGTAAGFYTGRISYVGLWLDGTTATGRKVIEVDWRVGPDFDGSDQRLDGHGSFLWTLQGTSPTYVVASSALQTVTASYNYTTDKAVGVQVRASQRDWETRYLPVSLNDTVISTGLLITVNQTIDSFVT